MVEHNAIKYDTALQVMLDRLGGVGLEDDGVSRFGETLTAVVNWRDLYEWYAVAGRNLAGGASTSVAAGGAGNRSIAILDNSTTNVIAILRRVYSTGVAGAGMYLQWIIGGATALGTAGTAVFLDWRRQAMSPPGQIGIGIPRLTVRTQNNAASPAGRIICPLRIAVANITTDLGQAVNVVLSPGSAVMISPDTDNVAMGPWGFEWEERQMLTGEPVQFKAGGN